MNIKKGIASITKSEVATRAFVAAAFCAVAIGFDVSDLLSAAAFMGAALLVSLLTLAFVRSRSV